MQALDETEGIYSQSHHSKEKFAVVKVLSIIFLFMNPKQGELHTDKLKDNNYVKRKHAFYTY